MEVGSYDLHNCTDAIEYRKQCRLDVSEFWWVYRSYIRNILPHDNTTRMFRLREYMQCGVHI